MLRTPLCEDYESGLKERISGKAAEEISVRAAETRQMRLLPRSQTSSPRCVLMLRCAGELPWKTAVHAVQEGLYRLVVLLNGSLRIIVNRLEE